MYFIGKYSIEGKNEANQPLGTSLIQRGKVISINDVDDAGRIKVRVMGVDNNLLDENLVFAVPLLPKHINIVPKVGDGVLIFRFESQNRNVDRMYLGPIVPQPQDLGGADYETKAWNAYSFGLTQLGPAPTKRKKLKGGYPEKEDISLQGKKNSDLILKEDEVLLRAGKFVFQGDKADNSRSDNEFDDIGGRKLKFNTRTQGYIQIKYNAKINIADGNKDKGEYGTITNVVSNKINLLTHKHGNPRFALTNQDNLISDEEMQKILKEAHPLVFGDKLVEFLKLMKNAILNHSHKYQGLPPHGEGQSLAAKSVQEMNSYDLDEILSKNIKIN